ncbi:cobalt ABC transporter ATP-binding protein, partial [Bifidobacteriaceae bacterium WP022]
RKTMYKRISEALKTVHMEDKRYDDPSTMSGGQQQRVALASAIAMNSKLLVLDEPTSMLDSFARKDVDALFDNLHKNGTTIVQITHNFEECKRANRILLLKNGILKEVSFNGLKTYLSNIELANNHLTKISKNKNLTDSRFKENESDIAVEISGLTVQYDKTSPAVIDDYSLTVKSGETVAIMGENGCGKSTLVKTMCGLLKANSGNITVHGISVRGKTSKIIRQKLHQTIGYVMQLPEQQLFADTVRND